MELSIDTSTNFAGIALTEKGELRAEMLWLSMQNHTVELVPNIQRLLEQVKTDQKSLVAVFVAIGPGSFNGLRVGVSTAKGLAYAMSIPIVGASTLEVEAYPLAFTGLPVCPVHNAGRGEIAAAVYQQGDRWRCLIKEHITTVEQLCAGFKTRTIICGDINAETSRQLQFLGGEYAIIPSPSARLRHASCLGELGWQKLQAGDQADLATLQPLYLRQPPITMRKVQ